MLAAGSNRMRLPALSAVAKFSFEAVCDTDEILVKAAQSDCEFAIDGKIAADKSCGPAATTRAEGELAAIRRPGEHLFTRLQNLP